MINCNQRHFTRLRIYAPPCVGKDGADSNNQTKLLVLEESRLWSNQTNITYSFLDKEKECFELYRKKALVTTAMDEYTKYANVKFQEKDGDTTVPNIRISFESEPRNGALVGTDALMTNSGPTVNLGEMNLVKDDKSNFAMALHAIGHVLGLLHEIKGHSTNFKQYDDASVMAYSGDVSERTELSDCDKAWLTLNYPKTPLNKPGEPGDIWTLHRSLHVLNVDSNYSSKVLQADDLSERRFLFCQFLATSQASPGEVSSLDDIKDMLGIYPVAIPGSNGDVLRELQVQTQPTMVPGRMVHNETLHPAEIEQYAFALLRAFGISFDPLPLTRTSKSKVDQYRDTLSRIQSLLENASLPESGSAQELPPLTRAQLDKLIAQLPGVLNSDLSPYPDIAGVQHGLLQLFQNPTVLTTLRSLFLNPKSYDVEQPHPELTQGLLKMLGNAPTSDIFQEIYHLCFASYLVHDFSGTQEKLQKKHQELLENLLPAIASTKHQSSWELKWGPAAWKEKRDDTSGGPDLVWYVAYNSSVSSFKDEDPRETYAIAIAGTQMRSDHTWLRSNLDVTSVTEFVTWVDSKFKSVSAVNVPHGNPYIAMGTARTVSRLLTEQAPHNAASGGGTLRQFLESTPKTSRVIVTGHSLGAALTPTLALALGEAGIISYDRMLTYPIAGPSPGNHVFAARFSKKFPPKPYASNEDYKIWNLNLVNKFDPVPYFWSATKLRTLHEAIPGFLFKSIDYMVGISSSIIGDLQKANVEYTPIQSQSFSLSLESVLDNHSRAYHEHVGITPPTPREVLR